MQNDEDEDFGSKSNIFVKQMQSDASYELFATKTTASLETPSSTPPHENPSNASVDADNRNKANKQQHNKRNDNDDHNTTITHSQSEPDDDDSSLVFFSEGDLPAVAFKPPYTAPLAPLLTPKEWKRKHSNTRNQKRYADHRSKTSEKNKRQSLSAKSKEKFKSYDSLCEMFIKRERYASASGDAGSELGISTYKLDDNASGNGSMEFYQDKGDGADESVELGDTLLQGQVHKYADKSGSGMEQ